MQEPIMFDEVPKGQSKAELNESLYAEGLKLAREAYSEVATGGAKAIYKLLHAAYAILQRVEADRSEGSKSLAKERVCRLVFDLVALGRKGAEKQAYEKETKDIFERKDPAELAIRCNTTAIACEEESTQNPFQAHKWEALSIFLYQEAVDNFVKASKEGKYPEASVQKMRDQIAMCLDRIVVLKTSARKDARTVAKLISQFEPRKALETKLEAQSPTKEPAAPLTLGKKRRRIMQEIVETEESYVRSLTVVAEVFIQPLADAAGSVESTILPGDQVRIIFSNWSVIQPLNLNFASALKERFGVWSEDVSTQSVADLFLQFAPYFKMYSQYVENYDESSVALRAAEKLPKFKDFLTKCLQDSRCGGQSLSSFLIMPIQRIPRYKLLLSELLKNSDDTCPEMEKLIKAEALVTQVATHINESVRAQQNRQQIREIEALFKEPPNFLAPHRFLVRPGLFTKKEAQGDVQCQVYLFNDLLAYAPKTVIPAAAVGKKFLRALKIPIDASFSVQTVGSTVTQGREHYCVEIKSALESFQMYTLEEEDLQSWLQDVQSCITDQRWRRISKNLGKPDSEEQYVAPVWQRNHTSPHCYICNVEFSTFTRRHHCRKCGKLVCHECSNTKVSLGVHGKFERVCSNCKPQKADAEEQLVWQEDGSSTQCPLCTTPFTYLTRRHHCRKCGTVVCNNCSLGRQVLGFSQVPQRCCDNCMGMSKTRGTMSKTSRGGGGSRQGGANYDTDEDPPSRVGGPPATKEVKVDEKSALLTEKKKGCCNIL